VSSFRPAIPVQISTGVDIQAGTCHGALVRLPDSGESIAALLGSPEQVATYVKSLSDDDLVALTWCLSSWRKNPVGAQLTRSQKTESREISVRRILLNEAECDLHSAWRRLGGRLTEIAADPEVLAHPEYARRRVGDCIEYPICLAHPVSGGHGLYRVVDGVHRAIQLARNGAESLTLCVFWPE
jgi:hypothetical protein